MFVIIEIAQTTTLLHTLPTQLFVAVVLRYRSLQLDIVEKWKLEYVKLKNC